MDLRSQAIENALQINAQETKTWEQYREEHHIVANNLQEFVKNYEIDIMVPVGSKALMPGKLYHTNEILVSHFQGYFSKVSTHKALEIVGHRVQVANERLKALETEREMYEQRLELPAEQQAFGEGQEIIEDYNEEEELKWRKRHRELVRKAKQDEAKVREMDEQKPKLNGLELLDELEMMEELENELETMNIEDDDLLEKIITGQKVLPPEKSRISHVTPAPLIPPPTPTKSKIVTTYTNNNHIANQQDFEPDLSDNEYLDDDDDDEIPEAFKTLLAEADSMEQSERQQFLKTKLLEVQKKIRSSRIDNETDLLNRIADIELKEVLEDVLMGLEEPTSSESGTEEMSSESKRISFSDDIKVEYINSKEAPNKVTAQNTKTPLTTSAPPKKPVPIKLREIPSPNPAKIQYDSNLTMTLNLTHSTDIFTPSGQEPETLGSPLDIYLKVKDIEAAKMNKKAKKTTKFANKTSTIQSDVATESENEVTAPSVPLKSILKNCDRVNAEIHHPLLTSKDAIIEDETEKPAAKPNKETFVCEAPPDFNTIVGDVVERVEPDPLPEGEFIDAVQPKKRISRFKASRKAT